MKKDIEFKRFIKWSGIVTSKNAIGPENIMPVWLFIIR